jgi:hydrogenase maturation factor
MPGGQAVLQKADGSAIGILYSEQTEAAVAALNLEKQDTVFVKWTSTTNTTATAQLLDLHVEMLQ